MKNNTTLRPTSSGWLSEDNMCVADYFDGLGFTSLQDILDMRIFDLMNMNRLNAIRVEEIITCLYLFLNPNTAVDEAMYEGLIAATTSLGGKAAAATNGKPASITVQTERSARIAWEERCSKGSMILRHCARI